MAGKGDKYRKVDKKKFDENFDRIFGNKISEFSLAQLKELMSITPTREGNLNEKCPECGKVNWSFDESYKNCWDCGHKWEHKTFIIK